MATICASNAWALNMPSVHWQTTTFASVKEHDKYSQLLLSGTATADTGKLSCWLLLCDGSECTKEVDKTTTTYIYITVNQLIKQRVITPAVKVALHMPPQEIPVDRDQISFDPKEGFIIHKPGSEHRGVFYCKASLQGTPQMSVKYQLLYVEDKIQHSSSEDALVLTKADF
ncbi:UNVERIFIED_CONTAM: hypothetical protein FKN15_077752 [Acipenser sinensis]